MEFPRDRDLTIAKLRLEREAQEAQRSDPVPGWWHASSFGGKCPQSLIRTSMGDDGDRGLSDKTRITFNTGSVLGRDAQQRAEALGILVRPLEGDEWYLRSEELRLSGYIDRLEVWPPTPDNIDPDIYAALITEFGDEAIPGYRAIEDKTIKASAMAYAPLWECSEHPGENVGHGGKDDKCKAPGHPGGPKPEHLLQIGAYVLLSRRIPEQLPGPLTSGAVVYLGKDSGGMLEFEIDLDAAAEAALQRVAYLTAEFAKPEVRDIDCTCETQFNGKGPLYCNHRTELELRYGPRGGKRTYAVCCQGVEYEGAFGPNDTELFKDIGVFV